MNTKALRNRHRKIFTHFIDEEIKEDVFVRRRVKNSSYKGLKEWIRSLPPSEAKFFIGKANLIWASR